MLPGAGQAYAVSLGRPPFEGLAEMHAVVGPVAGAALVVGLAEARGECGDAALLEVLVHEGVDDRVVEGVEEANGLHHRNDHVNGDLIVVFLQVI